MKAKIWVPILIVVVSVGAFLLGRQYQTGPLGVEEAAEAPPPAAVAPPAAEELPPPPELARPLRPRAIPTPRAPEPAPAPPEPTAPTNTGVRPVETEALPPPPAPEPVKVRLAEGTKIVFTLNDTLSSKTSRAGDPFNGVVSRSVRVGNTIAIPEGSVIRGTVGQVQRPGRVKGRAALGLRFDQLELPDGQVYNLSASLTELDEAEKESVTEEGQVRSEGTKKRDAVTIGGGAGVGAIIGAISGGGKGAATGTAIGAGAGTAVVLLTRGKDVEIKRGSELAIQLDRPLAVTMK